LPDGNRPLDHDHIQFDFLSYTFKPRSARNRWGKLFCNFLPAISAKATQAITAEVASWNIHRMSDKELSDLSRKFNPILRAGSVTTAGITPVPCDERWNVSTAGWHAGHEENTKDWPHARARQ